MKTFFLSFFKFTGVSFTDVACGTLKLKGSFPFQKWGKPLFGLWESMRKAAQIVQYCETVAFVRS